MTDNKLRELIDSNGISQSELTKEAGVSSAYINKVCLKKVTPAPKTKHKILQGLNDLTGKGYSLSDIFEVN